MGHSEEYGCGLVDKGWEIGIVKVIGKEKKIVSVKVNGITRERGSKSSKYSRN